MAMVTRFLHRGPEQPTSESPAERDARIAYERELIEEARREIADGHAIKGDDARELLRALREGRPISIPDTSSPRLR
ncbi:hypothetical protein [Salinarimonas rosea]|uniref:hypothetical protein n=1 Tax=Salinarimonas rosea TaxID=552063 RepID=UPI0012EB5C5D|nr:hypothetical protein [Salinarimonas rosea]